MPMGRTPGRLSSSTRRHAISAQYADQGWGDLAIQSDRLATTNLKSSDAHQEQRGQLRSSIASSPSAPAATESFDATHVTSSSVKSRGTVSGTYPYFSKAAHMGFSTGGHVCLGISPGGPLQPVARFSCIGRPGGDTPPSPCQLPN